MSHPSCVKIYVATELIYHRFYSSRGQCCTTAFHEKARKQKRSENGKTVLKNRVRKVKRVRKVGYKGLI